MRTKKILNQKKNLSLKRKLSKKRKGGAAKHNSRTITENKIEILPFDEIKNYIETYLKKYYPYFPSKRIPISDFFGLKEATKMGRFSFKNNSCWLDSSIFALLTTGNSEIITTLLKYRDTGDCKILAPIDLPRQTYIKFLLQSKLTMAHNFIMNGMGGSMCLNSLRTIFSCCPATSVYNDVRSHRYGSPVDEFINHLFEIFPLPVKNHLVTETNTYHVLDEEDILKIDESIMGLEINQKITEASKTLTLLHNARDIIAGEKGYNPAINQKKFTYKGSRVIIKVQDLEQEYGFIVPYRINNEINRIDVPCVFPEIRVLEKTQNLSNILFDKFISTSSEYVVYQDDANIYITNMSASFTKIKTNSSFIYIHSQRANPNPTELRLQDNIIIPDETLSHPNFTNISNQRIEMELQAIIIRTGNSRSSTHFFVYFRYEDNFYKYNDMRGGIINVIGTYDKLIDIDEVKKNSFSFLYQHKGVQLNSIKLSRESVPTGPTLSQGAAAHVPGSTMPPKKKTSLGSDKENLLRQAKELGLDKKINFLKDLPTNIIKAKVEREISVRKEKLARKIAFEGPIHQPVLNSPSAGKTKKKSSNSWEKIEMP